MEQQKYAYEGEKLCTSCRECLCKSALVPFPPIRTDLAAPAGPYLSPITQSTEGGRSYISRSGFLDYTTSTYFVSRIRKQVEHVLMLFSVEWLSIKEKAGEYNHSFYTPPADDPHSLEWSPFQLLQRIYEEHGWNFVQFTWSEHEPTRTAMYETCTRVLMGEYCIPWAKGILINYL